ncbi:TPA: hypothetical protein HA239_02690 [Candidatus Woesearchaeota archaeon]|nr:hypothetical protein QT06_C0001G1138 [archaeon GW2011_AR15]MBS3104392.1 hypothetical protein [Candidatus Woesearchaeota archaeon]HIH41296.1 hypothetical protein [Candidatus Woesearchaeota archaeon]
MKLKLLLIVLAMLLLVSSVTAKTLDEHMNELLAKDGSDEKLPSGVSLILSGSTIQAYIVPEEYYSDYAAKLDDDPISFVSWENKTFTYAIIAETKSSRLKSIKEGEMLDEEPDVIILASEASALRVFESENGAKQAAAEVGDGNIIYEITSGWLRFKMSMLEALAKFLGLFSQSIRDLLPIFG